jgi:hypothetical protein
MSNLVATFRSADDTGDDHEIGTVTWDGATAVAEPPKGFLADVAKSVSDWSDPEGAMRELPLLYKSAYLRASLVDKGHVDEFSEQDWSGPTKGPQGGTYWTHRKTGEVKYSDKNPGGAAGASAQQPAGSASSDADPALKAYGQKYAAQARERFGDQAHEKLTQLVAKLQGDTTPEGAKKLAAAKATLTALGADQAKQEHGDDAHAQVGAAIDQAKASGDPQAAAHLESVKDALGPEPQAKVNEKKRANMDPEAIQTAKAKQYANTERGKAEAEREQADAELKAKREKEDADLQKHRDTMTERHEKEIAAADDAITDIQNHWAGIEEKRQEDDDALSDAREAEDEKISANIDSEDEAIGKQREEEDAGIVSARTARREEEDAAIDAAREKEDADIEAVRSPVRDKLAEVYDQAEPGTPEEVTASKALDAFEANADKEGAKLATKREKEDEKRSDARDKEDDKEGDALTAKREKEDKKRESEREKQEAKLTTSRDKEDAALAKSRDKEEEQINADEAKLEAQKNKVEEAHQTEIDDLDQHESDIEADRESEDEDTQAARDEEDADFDIEEENETEKATELIDSFEETDTTEAEPPEAQLDAVRKYNEKAAMKGDRARITWYEGTSFQGWFAEDVDAITYDNFDKFCPLPKEAEKPATFAERPYRKPKSRRRKPKRRRKRGALDFFQGRGAAMFAEKEKPVPKTGARDICRSCGYPIEFKGEYWSHKVDGAPELRHPARPTSYARKPEDAAPQESVATVPEEA